MQRSRATRALLTLVLILTFVAPSAYGATQAEVRAHEEAARAARAAAAAAQSEADRLSAEVAEMDRAMAAIQGDIDSLVDDVASATDRTERLEAEVAALRAQIIARQSEIDATQAEYERQQALLADRVQTTYKNSDFIYLELLLESRDIEDFITRTTMVQRVMKSNSEIADDLRKTRVSIEKVKAEVERDLLAVDAKRAEAEAEENRIRGLRAQHQAKLNTQEALQNQKAGLLEENQQNADRLRALAEAEEAESNRISRELAGSGSGQYNGVMAWPVPGFYRVTSPFGPRICPFHGPENHSGIDIGRNTSPAESIDGASIVAAGDGKVISAGSRSGYGNTVIIDHGNGVTTLYAHQRSGGIKVSVGQSVKKGDRIGTVGSTGNSTGPHLHFEVRINGNATDPMRYLK